MKKISKTDCHVHLRGSVSKKEIINLVDKYSANSIKSTIKENHKDFLKTKSHLDIFFDDSKSSLERSSSLYSFNNLIEFFASYLLSAYLFQDKDDLNYLLNVVSKKFKDEEIQNLDLIVSPHHFLVGGKLTLSSVLDCLSSHNFEELNVNWVIDPVRDRGEEFCINLVNECNAINQNLFTAINLGGNEDKFPSSQFKKLYKVIHELGMEARIHAGETNNIENIEFAVKDLGCKRIGHGIAAVRSQELMKYLADNKIALEICISSNLNLGSSKLEFYPLRELYDEGIPILICTDDPGFLNTSLEKEYEIVRGLGFSDSEVLGLIENSELIFKNSF